MAEIEIHRKRGEGGRQEANPQKFAKNRAPQTHGRDATETGECSLQASFRVHRLTYGRPEIVSGKRGGMVMVCRKPSYGSDWRFFRRPDREPVARAAHRLQVLRPVRLGF